jgi:DNA recombination protein RmuC
MASFSELATESLAKTNKTFLELAEQNFDKHQTQAKANLKEREQAVEHLVKPIKEALEKTTRQIGEIEKAREAAYGGISEQLKAMTQSHESLRSETSKLVGALRSPTVRGQWGEMTLRRLAELAGMVNHCDFSEQVHTTDEDNRGYRPDMVVRLPEKGQLVVDVKTPLDAYLDATEATDEVTRKEALKRHAANVSARIKELSSKSYIDQFENSPEFVILFVPGDQFLTAALDEKPTLLEDALAQKVLLATPTSLIALLKVVAYGWMQLNLAENAEEIKKLAIQMQDRLGTFTGHLATVGARLSASVSSYNKAVASLETRVLPTTRKIRELGADSGKDTPTPQSIDITARELKLIADDLKTDGDDSDTPDIEERPQ